ncbi:hypothetical protein NFI96_014704 [Prochilodus magdalenae]|nr:hypothetical protein NFI96_014704 [Prochilodus magdalenae]
MIQINFTVTEQKPRRSSCKLNSEPSMKQEPAELSCPVRAQHAGPNEASPHRTKLQPFLPCTRTAAFQRLTGQIGTALSHQTVLKSGLQGPRTLRLENLPHSKLPNLTASLGSSWERDGQYRLVQMEDGPY